MARSIVAAIAVLPIVLGVSCANAAEAFVSQAQLTRFERGMSALRASAAQATSVPLPLASLPAMLPANAGDTQSITGSRSSVVQSGNANLTTVMQIGGGNLSTIIQQDRGNTALVVQTAGRR